MKFLAKLEPGATPVQPGVLKVQTPPRRVTGRNIAHGKRSPVERAVLAADIVAGRAVITDLTAKQVAALLKTKSTYVAAARRLSRAERCAVRDGLRPLVVEQAARRHAGGAVLSDAETLADIVARRGVDAALEMIVAIETAAAA